MDKSNKLPEGFVYVADIDPTIIVNLRYASNDNVCGGPISGYKSSTAGIITQKAGESLVRIQRKLLEDGYCLVLYDSYRPQRAVDHFIAWSQNVEEQTMKEPYYPKVDKEKLFELGYFAKKSGHTRGSTVDVSFVEKGKRLGEVNPVKRKFLDGREYMYLEDGTVDMGTSWDFLDLASHYENEMVEEEVKKRRSYLRQLFEKEGWTITPREWWHFRMVDEPFPETYFDFEVA